MDTLIHLIEVIGSGLIVAVGAWVSIRVETSVLKVRMGNVEDELKQMGNILVSLAETKGRMDRMDDRAMMQGGRIDELAKAVREMAGQFQELLIQGHKAS